MDKNKDDQSLAKELQRQLSGGVKLDAPRIKLTPMFAAHEATALGQARTERRETERHYNDLRQQEAELPVLEKETAAAENAQRRREQLNQAIDLHHAIQERKARAEEANSFPPDMHLLAGNEVTLLAAYLQEAFAAVAGAAAAIFAALWALWDERRTKGPSPSEEAKHSFTETDLAPPSEWTPTTVRERL